MGITRANRQFPDFYQSLVLRPGIPNARSRDNLTRPSRYNPAEISASALVSDTMFFFFRGGDVCEKEVFDANKVGTKGELGKGERRGEVTKK